MSTFQELYDASESLRRGHHRKAAGHLSAAITAFQEYERRTQERERLIAGARDDADVKAETALATLSVWLAPTLSAQGEMPGDVVKFARSVLEAIGYEELLDAWRAQQLAPRRPGAYVVETTGAPGSES